MRKIIEIIECLSFESIQSLSHVATVLCCIVFLMAGAYFVFRVLPEKKRISFPAAILSAIFLLTTLVSVLWLRAEANETSTEYHEVVEINQTEDEQGEVVYLVTTKDGEKYELGKDLIRFIENPNGYSAINFVAYKHPDAAGNSILKEITIYSPET